MYSKAGRSRIMEPIGTWWDTQNEDSCDIDDDEKASIKAIWHPLCGDRVQQLVFIGVDMDKNVLHQKLNNALVNDAEAAMGVELWFTLKDPLHLWG